MYEMTNEERLACAKFVKDTAAGRCPVIASGSFGETPEAMAAFINEMATIVDAVVLLPSNLVPAEADEATLKGVMEKLVSLTGRSLSVFMRCQRLTTVLWRRKP